jgi:hypothetical protein
MSSGIRLVRRIRKDMKTEYGFSNFRSVTESGAASFESIIWIVSCLATISGVVMAANSTQPLLWLAVWPFPVTLACTIFIFLRQGFHLEDGVLVLGRRPRGSRLAGRVSSLKAAMD